MGRILEGLNENRGLVLEHGGDVVAYGFGFGGNKLEVAVLALGELDISTVDEGEAVHGSNAHLTASELGIDNLLAGCSVGADRGTRLTCGGNVGKVKHTLVVEDVHDTGAYGLGVDLNKVLLVIYGVLEFCECNVIKGKIGCKVVAKCCLGVTNKNHLIVPILDGTVLDGVVHYGVLGKGNAVDVEGTGSLGRSDKGMTAEVNGKIGLDSGSKVYGSLSGEIRVLEHKHYNLAGERLIRTAIVREGVECRCKEGVLGCTLCLVEDGKVVVCVRCGYHTVLGDEVAFVSSRGGKGHTNHKEGNYDDSRKKQGYAISCVHCEKSFLKK